jgi:hypothetical protein
MIKSAASSLADPATPATGASSDQAGQIGCALILSLLPRHGHSHQTASQDQSQKPFAGS